MKFRTYLSEANARTTVLTKLKAQLRKAGFISWEFEGDYEVLKVTFKDNSSAIKASRKYREELNSLGNASIGNGVIVLEFDDDALRNLNEK